MPIASLPRLSTFIGLLGLSVQVITSSSSSNCCMACYNAQSTSLSTLQSIFRNKVCINLTLIHVSSLVRRSSLSPMLMITCSMLVMTTTSICSSQHSKLMTWI
ncbi:hypothetical protein ACHAWX_000024, partial [Stephanocyclus meneghinianus]